MNCSTQSDGQRPNQAPGGSGEDQQAAMATGNSSKHLDRASQSLNTLSRPLFALLRSVIKQGKLDRLVGSQTQPVCLKFQQTLTDLQTAITWVLDEQ